MRVGRGAWNKGGTIWLTWPLYSVKSSIEMVCIIVKAKPRGRTPIE